MPRLSANSCSPAHVVSLCTSHLCAVAEVVDTVAYLCDLVVNHLLVRHIALVAHEQLVHAFGGVTINLLQPLLDVVEGVHVGHVVDDADAMRATVVGGCDGTEAFLPCCIPLDPIC